MALKNALGDIALDDSVVLLRRIVKLLESSNAVDSAGRQRVAIDSSISLTTTVGAITTITTLTNLAAIAGLDQRQFHDTARIAYNSGVRRALVFS